MRTLHWLAIVGLVVSAGLVACGSDSSSGTGGGGGAATGGSGGATGGSGGATGGSAGSATGGSAGSATGGSAGSATGGSAGSATGGSAGSATGGSAGSGTGGSAGSGSLWTSTCVQDCITNNQQGVGELIGYITPCLCTTNGGACKTECANYFCATPPDLKADAACGDCALAAGNSTCASDLGPCLNSTTCTAAVSCLTTCAQ